MAKVSRYFDIDLEGDLPGLLYERRDHIAFITLHRPERGNALAPVMHAVARAIWSDVRENDDIALTGHRVPVPRQQSSSPRRAGRRRAGCRRRRPAPPG